MSSVRGVNVGGNLFGVTDSTNIAPIETTNFATRAYAKGRCFIMVDGLLYRATAEIESGDPIVINGNCKRTTLDEIISVIETDSDLIAPTEDGATSSADYAVGNEIVRSGILYKVISAITQGDAFAIGSNIEIAGSLTSQIQTLKNNDDTMLNVLGAKNLLSNNATTKVVNGVTFTVNPSGYLEGTISINGTASEDTWFGLTGGNVAVYSKRNYGNRYLSGGISNEIQLQVYWSDDGSTWGGTIVSGGNDVLIPNKNYYSQVFVWVKGGTTVNDAIVYPMIRPVGTDDTYVPYAMTNRELTEDVRTTRQEVAFKAQDNGRVSQTSIDPNDITVTSLYNVTNSANMPDLGWWFVFTLVHSTNSSYITQFALKMADDWHEMCVREKNSGVWNSWQSIATRGVYRTQTKEVTITANASGWSYASVTWATPFIYTPHVSVAVSGAGMIPEPVAITVLNLTGVQVGMYAKNHDLKVMITATGWVKE